MSYSHDPHPISDLHWELKPTMYYELQENRVGAGGKAAKQTLKNGSGLGALNFVTHSATDAHRTFQENKVKACSSLRAEKLAAKHAVLFVLGERK